MVAGLRFCDASASYVMHSVGDEVATEEKKCEQRTETVKPLVRKKAHCEANRYPPLLKRQLRRRFDPHRTAGIMMHLLSARATSRKLSGR